MARWGRGSRLTSSGAMTSANVASFSRRRAKEKPPRAILSGRLLGYLRSMPPQTKLKADPREQYAQPKPQDSRYRAGHAALLPSMDASFSLVASMSTWFRRSSMSAARNI